MRVNEPEAHMNKPLHNVASTINTPSASVDDPVLSELTAQRALEITQGLQTSLDPTRLIEIFSMEVGVLIVH